METVPVPIPFPGCRNTQGASLDPEVLPWGFPGIFLCQRSPNPEIFLNFSIADESLELEFRAGDAEPGFRKGTPPRCRNWGKGTNSRWFLFNPWIQGFTFLGKRNPHPQLAPCWGEWEKWDSFLGKRAALLGRRVVGLKSGAVGVYFPTFSMCFALKLTPQKNKNSQKVCSGLRHHRKTT